MTKTILILETDSRMCDSLIACAETAGFWGQAVASADAFADAAKQAAPVATVLIGPGVGAEAAQRLLADLSQHAGAPPVVALSVDPQVEPALSLLRAGAVEVLPADAPVEAVCEAVRRTDTVAQLTCDPTRIKGHSDAAIRLEDLGGASDEIARAISLAERAARFHLHVLLEGERGTGKCLMAQAIHGASGRANAPFETIDCNALSGREADHILFDRRNGAYWRARGGSLFLREINALPASAQIRLATLLETPDRPARELLQDNKPEVRLLASTSVDMLALIKQGAFRDDLFYRLNVCPIWMPPLRERRDDIPALAHGFMRAFALKTRRVTAMLSEAAAAMLARYAWPGNLEELEREVYRAVLLAQGAALEPQHFPRIAAHTGLAGGSHAPSWQRSSAPWREAGRHVARGQHVPALVEGMAAGALAAQSGAGSCVGIPALTERGDVRSLDEVEADMIRLALGRYRGSMTEAARRLGIGRSTLYRKMREFGLDARSSSR